MVWRMVEGAEFRGGPRLESWLIPRQNSHGRLHTVLLWLLSLRKPVTAAVKREHPPIVVSSGLPTTTTVRSRIIESSSSGSTARSGRWRSCRQLKDQQATLEGRRSQQRCGGSHQSAATLPSVTAGGGGHHGCRCNPVGATLDCSASWFALAGDLLLQQRWQVAGLWTSPVL